MSCNHFFHLKGRCRGKSFTSAIFSLHNITCSNFSRHQSWKKVKRKRWKRKRRDEKLLQKWRYYTFITGFNNNTNSSDIIVFYHKLLVLRLRHRLLRSSLLPLIFPKTSTMEEFSTLSKVEFMNFQSFSALKLSVAIIFPTLASLKRKQRRFRH